METRDMPKILSERGHYAREAGCEVLGVPDIVGSCANRNTAGSVKSEK